MKKPTFTLTMKVDTKTLRARGVKPPTDAPAGRKLTAHFESATPTRIRLRESQYGQVMVTVDRATGIEVGGSIVGYRLGASDLKALTRAIDTGALRVYVRWFDSTYSMTPTRAREMAWAILRRFNARDNLGVNFKDYGSLVSEVPKGALVFDAGSKFQSKRFWDSMHSKMIKF